MRKPISITLSTDNLLWLRGQAIQTKKGSVSEVVDRLVGEARLAGWTEPQAVRTVVGTVDIPEEDANLAGADAYIRELFSVSARRPAVVRERAAGSKGRRVKKARRG